MGDQYIRFCQLTAGSVQIGGAYDAPGQPEQPSLRVRFEIGKTSAITPNIAKIMVTNLRADRGTALLQLAETHGVVTLDAGYQSGHGVIFKGNAVQGIAGRENPTDTLLTLYASDGDQAHNHAVVNTTHPPGSTPQQHVDTAMQAMSGYGVTKGFVGIDLSQPVYSRAVVLYGMARDVLANVAKSKNATVSYQDMQMTMVAKGQSAPGSAVELNASTGLVGMPTQTSDGIFARCLINPQIKVHGQVHIDESLVQQGAWGFDQTGTNQMARGNIAGIAADGIYTVCKINLSGDSRGNPWYMDIGMLASAAIKGVGVAKPVNSSLWPYLGST
jgi:hypothetical protein